MNGLIALFALVGAIWCAIVASNKNLNVLGYTLVGFFLPLIGVIAVSCAKPQQPEPAP